ncbi:nitroreductase family protein [Leucothrix pacifica]|uniref:Nitroreductase n=1 Tax=Leucothrix pacifica TaxID=1247513 RepID=A0A317C7S1_9GAMM|nr:nitroreductase family protein [Leucothrix pacifica]PWQ92162.1 nitroreductase [Leucothrix pacifica]
MTQHSETLSPDQLTTAVDQVIQTRKSVKVIGDVDNIPDIPDGFFEEVQAAMKVAGWAPFHYTAHTSHLDRDMDSPVPWRFYALDQKNCLRLIDALMDHPELGLNKNVAILRMIAAYGALVLVTWLPEPETGNSDEEIARIADKNEEHVAAAAAATQNLLLAATARGMDSYWSSGGTLRDKVSFEICQIPLQERLLGAVFLAPDMPDREGVRPGKWRDKRGNPEQWMTSVSI